MPLLQTIHLEHLPADYLVHVALFRDIQNAVFLHQQLLAGNTEYEYALIDASVILSPIHALAAAYRAVNDLLSSRLKSRNVHSEIVFSLSPNNNIAESFRRFGITPETKNLLVIKISTPSQPFASESVETALSNQVEGDQVEFSENVLESMTDVVRVKKIYKLNPSGGGGPGKKSNGISGANGVQMNDIARANERRELEIAVLGAMSLRGVTN